MLYNTYKSYEDRTNSILKFTVHVFCVKMRIFEIYFDVLKKFDALVLKNPLNIDKIWKAKQEKVREKECLKHICEVI